ncbi:MAG: MauE/DoxX family redox-associated membrane protein [Gemmatimonadaceae bacterium]
MRDFASEVTKVLLAELTFAAALLLAGVLSIAALSKMRSFGVFREQAADYRIFPYKLTSALAAGVIVLELSAATMLLIPPTRKLGAVITAALLAGFLVAMALTLRRGRRVSCGCFGGAGALDVVGAPGLVRTSALLIVSLLATLPYDFAFSLISVLAAFTLAAILGTAVFLLSEVTRLTGDIRESKSAVVLKAGRRLQEVA